MHYPLVLMATLCGGPLVVGEEKTTPVFPGQTKSGFLLPNGWTISPAGKSVVVGDLPLNIIPLSGSRHALVATSGYNKHELSLVDLGSLSIAARSEVLQSWYGLALSKVDSSTSAHKVWWSGGGGDLVHTLLLEDNKLRRIGPAEPDIKTIKEQEKRTGIQRGFKSGLVLDSRRGRLLSLDINAGMIAALALKDGQVIKSAKIGGRPYDVLISSDRGRLYVSDWAGKSVLVLDADDLQVAARIPVGDHPCQLALHPKDDRLFVACASSNSVSVIDPKAETVKETIVTSLFPRAPEGSTPDALAISPDGSTLYVANADNNCVTVIDVAVPGKSGVRGFIPSGWYPTAVAVTPDGKNLLIGSGKGNQSSPNPFIEEKEKPGAKAKKPEGEFIRRPFKHLGTLLTGAVAVVPIPDDRQLAKYTATVYRNCPYSDKLLSGVSHPVKTAIPTKVGEPSPIKYVIYIIRENRTYDQVFGDMKRGNGDPSLCMFPEKVTPNAHKLAREFVLLDNLYCNGHVSADGHPWSTMAYATDFISRNWHLTYSGRRGVRDNDKDNLSKAPSGYLWDACAKARISYRSYGEYGHRVSQKDGTFKIEGGVPGLVGHMCPDYGLPKKDEKYLRDTDRVDVFLREYREFENKETMPRFIVMSLPEDHTWGTTPGAPTPIAAVASNDLALGGLVEAVSQGKYWKETAIFVIEDDAQNGPDHVDALRTVGLVISPYVRRGHLDSTQYSTVSMIRTMELILGLKPLSQYDAAARPMFQSFSDKADLTPYSHERAQVDLGEVNSKKAYGAARSARMDFSDVDRIDDFELNEILWRSIHGPNSPLPAVVRRAIADRPADPVQAETN